MLKESPALSSGQVPYLQAQELLAHDSRWQVRTILHRILLLEAFLCFLCEELLKVFLQMLSEIK